MSATATADRPPVGKKYLRLHDVAALFGVSRHTVRNWWQSGVIPPGAKLGKFRVWTEEEISEAVRARSTAAAV